MASKIWMTAVILCGVTVSNTGCAQQEDPAAQIRLFLTTERGPEDVLPSIPEVSGLDVESSREAGTLGTLRYFVAAYNVAGACLIIVDSTSNAVASACGSDVSGLRTDNSQVGGAEVVTSGEEVPADWVRLNDFLIVNPEATH